MLLLRRPPVLLLLSPALRRTLNRSDLAFVGWFGPIGIAAIYYAALAWKHLHDPLVWNCSSAVIFASIAAHGVTAAPLTRLYNASPGHTPPRTAGLDSDEDENEC